MGLDDCQPAPNKPSVGTIAETSIALSWAAVGGASKYRVEHRPTRTEFWNVSTDSITAGTHTVTGLTCSQEYLFRVSAYGDGTTYAAAWSDPSALLKASTAACTPPVFGAESYTFSVTADAVVDAAVGSVSATDAVTYAVTAGNEDGLFDIDESTGAITVAATLTGLAGTTYTLTVEAEDESGRAATVTVTITVTKT